MFRSPNKTKTGHGLCLELNTETTKPQALIDLLTFDFFRFIFDCYFTPNSKFKVETFACPNNKNNNTLFEKTNGPIKMQAQHYVKSTRGSLDGNFMHCPLNRE